MNYNNNFIEKTAQNIASFLKTEEEQEQNWRDFIKKQLPYERKFKKVLQDLFEKQKKEVFANMKKKPLKKGIEDDWIFGRKEWEQKFFKDMQPIIWSSLESSGSAAMLKLGIGIGFDVEIPEVRAMMDKFINNYVTKASIKINETTSFFLREELKTGLGFGESMEELAKRVNTVFGNAEKVRSMAIARTETIRSSNRGNVIAWKQSGVVEAKEFYTALDEGVCIACANMHGKTIGLDERYFEQGDEQDFSEGDGNILHMNFDYSDVEEPPIHPRCYDKETEIYTKQGWMYFNDLVGSEKILSINPETYKIDWLPIYKLVKYKYSGEMIKYYSNNLDMQITLDHQLVYRKDWDRKIKRDKLNFVEAQKMSKHKGSFYRTCKWTGDNEKDINIGDLIISMKLFCIFMGYYLSEGSTTKRKNKKDCYQISIHQNSEGLEKIYDDVKDLPVKLSKGKNKIYCFNKDLAKYLIKFGHSSKKYIPEEIKNTIKENIEIFLDAYCFGDGTIKKGKYWKGYKFRDQRTFFTSSDAMASDLGELILKIGHHPSYKLDKIKGKEQKFKNGTYTINNDLWRITDCRSKYASVYDIKKVYYEGMVYCVCLFTNHTLYVRRNGKCVWSGNCRCTVLPVLKKV